MTPSFSTDSRPITPEDFLNEAKSILNKKAHDYTSGDTTRFENFERQALVSSWFKNDIDKVFACMVTVKLARLASCLDSKIPNNESIEDSFVDLINYCALWASWRSSWGLQVPSGEQKICDICENNYATHYIKLAEQFYCDDCYKAYRDDLLKSEQDA